MHRRLAKIGKAGLPDVASGVYFTDVIPLKIKLIHDKFAEFMRFQAFNIKVININYSFLRTLAHTQSLK